MPKRARRSGEIAAAARIAERIRRAATKGGAPREATRHERAVTIARMRRVALSLALLGMVVSGYLAFVGVARRIDVPRERIEADGGYAYTILLDRSWAPGRLIAQADSDAEPAASSLVLREDGLDISRPHARVEDVRALGEGRLAHRGKRVHFATRDNSDPRENGRRYEFDYHRYSKARTFYLACAAFVLLLAWKQTAAVLRWLAGLRRHPLLMLPPGWFDAAWPPRRFGIRVLRMLAVYLLLVAAFSAYWSRTTHAPPQPVAGGDQELPNRFAYYEAHRDDFDLIFLGDSRTYCGIHPERIDPLLGSRSINLSSFANWFPTQYAQAKRLAAIVPPGATVVVTVGQINFSCLGKIQRVFPIEIPTALLYTTLRIPQEGLWDNVAFFHPYLHFWSIRGDLHEAFLRWARAPRSETAPAPAKTATPATVATAAADGGTPKVPMADVLAPPVDPSALNPHITERPALPADVAAIVRRFGSDPDVTDVDVSEDGDRITSVIAYYRGGGYYRTEVDPAFFRERQQGAPRAIDVEVGPNGERSVAPPPPDCLGLFERILSEFQRRGIRVIVNEIDEAPYVFGSEENRQAFREILRTIVRPRVEARGIPYVTTDQDRLRNEDYFDYNHLNSSGIAKYTPMLAAALRPLLAAPAPERR